jgi:hypothetical protein
MIYVYIHIIKHMYNAVFCLILTFLLYRYINIPLNVNNAKISQNRRFKSIMRILHNANTGKQSKKRFTEYRISAHGRNTRKSNFLTIPWIVREKDTISRIFRIFWQFEKNEWIVWQFHMFCMNFQKTLTA